MKTKILIISFGLISILGISCASLSEYVTPARVDEKAVAYAEEAGVVEPNAFDGYANLDKANKLAQAVVAAYEVNTLAITQLQEKNTLDYSILNEVVVRNYQQAVAREEQMFGETGIFSMGLSLAGFGGLGGLLGLMRKRPGDWTTEDMETALEDADINLSDKEIQITEVVKGVQGFIDEHTDDPLVADLKGWLDKKQSASTKEIVAQIKAII